ncbi:MAG: phosphoglycerate kinase [Gemmatimonadetes bacterium]|nr:phosphoglycerate kinase [Gemmatimonadota bacterium]NNM06752.1 phosphoglycerate kinase [Gemmatimonadota bacterium]
MQAKTVVDLPDHRISGSRILVRVDFNVPLDPDRRITDDIRIVRALPTLSYLLERGGRLIVTSHLARPKGVDPAFSLRPVAEHLSGLLDFPVRFCPELVGPVAQKAVNDLDDGQLLLLENTRFHEGEKKNDPELSRELADLCDLFVNDAFGSAHRAHASTVGAAEVLRERGREAVGGFLMEKELRYLGMALEAPDRPFAAVLGGAKISGKIEVIQSLLPKVDRLIIGGAMANTFFKALGLETGKSLVEEERVELARETLEEAGEKILLPVDCVVAPEISAGAPTREAERAAVEPEEMIGDIGKGSRALFADALAGAGTVVWNGPMGVFEMPPFAGGTLALAEAVAVVSDHGGTTIVGGGDSASAAEQAGVADRLSHVSTGGGASLEFLSGAVLPGVAALDKKEGSSS